ncbi:MAG: hypothetical protein ACI8WB_006138 [Phenylobacterium sp.]
MTDLSQQPQQAKPLLKRLLNWAVRFMIRSKKLTQVCYNTAELDEMIGEDLLPYRVEFDVPGGQAELTVMTAAIGLGKNNDEGLQADLLCSLQISSMGQQLYRAHIQTVIKALPYYHKAQQSIRLKDTDIRKLTLINDEYLLMHSTTGLIKSLTPNIVQGLISATVGSAVGIMSALTTPEVKGYLAMFTDGNKQRVLDFHRGQVERTVKEMVDNGELEYQLNQSDFEENLFADMGQKIDVEDHLLVFRF